MPHIQTEPHRQSGSESMLSRVVRPSRAYVRSRTNVRAYVGARPGAHPVNPEAAALESAPARQRLSREDRIRRTAEYKALREGSRRVHTRHFVILVRPRKDQPGTRLGITVTKRVANAVGRNRIKRVVKEVFRRQRSLFPAGCDVVLIARAGADSLSYAQVATELERARPQLIKAACDPQNRVAAREDKRRQVADRADPPRSIR